MWPWLLCSRPDVSGRQLPIYLSHFVHAVLSEGSLLSIFLWVWGMCVGRVQLRPHGKESA